MAITVSSALTAATVSSVKPRLSVQYVNLQTEVTAVVAAADVSYIYMLVNASLDVRGLYPILGNEFTAADASSLGVLKSLEDASTASDAISPFVLGKGLQDLFGTADEKGFFLSTGRVDVFVSSDQAVVDSGKALADTAVHSDQHGLLLSTVKEDGFFSADGGQFAENDYAEITYFAELYISNSSPLMFVGKNLSDGVDATDDFLGEVNSDDDQTAFMGKSVTDAVPTSETFSHTAIYFRTLNDSFASLDSTGSLFGKSLSDASSVSDLASFIVNYGRGYEDALAAVETLSQAIGKPLSDSAAIADAFSYVRIAERLFNESVTYAESIAGSLSKPLTDSVSTLDQRSGVFGKAATDAVDASDSGSIYISNYADASYFAADYAGNYQTF